jgi:hypothetical protein
MKRKTLSCKMSLLVIFGAFIFLSSEESSGFPAGSNCWHLNSPSQAKSNADLVCKVRVVSIRREEDIRGSLFPGAPDVSRMIARSKVLSVIKGECPDVINIEFRHPKDDYSRLGLPPGGLYTDLLENEVCIVFLKASKPYYKLNRIRSKLRVPREAVDYNLGDTPNLRLLAEFLAGCESDDEMVKLQAAEELGYLGEAMITKLRETRGNKELEPFQKTAIALGKAKDALRKSRLSKDLVIRNVSIFSSFQVDDSPGIEGPLELLRMNPSDFDPNDSLKKYGIRDFCISSLQLRLLETMDATTRRFVVNLKDGSLIRRQDGSPYPFRGVRGFDYAEFYRQALDCEPVKRSEQMRRAIANVIWIRYERASVPEMMRLLDDSHMHIRHTAVSALRKCINSDLSNSWEPRHFYDPVAARQAARSGFEKKLEDRQKDYQDNEQEYILYWKKWWRDNKSRFETAETINNGTD